MLELRNNKITINNNVNNGNQLIISGVELIKFSSEKLERLNEYINYLSMID